MLVAPALASAPTIWRQRLPTKGPKAACKYAWRPQWSCLAPPLPCCHHRPRICLARVTLRLRSKRS
eukprot:6353243-Lingulodinium_polyedra.AAC.1